MMAKRSVMTATHDLVEPSELHGEPPVTLDGQLPREEQRAWTRAPLDQIDEIARRAADGGLRVTITVDHSRVVGQVDDEGSPSGTVQCEFADAAELARLNGILAD